MISSLRSINILNKLCILNAFILGVLLKTKEFVSKQLVMVRIYTGKIFYLKIPDFWSLFIDRYLENKDICPSSS
jgi:hypothetical protein